MQMWKRLIPKGPQLEIFKFAVCISSPILLMLYIGNNTHDKLNVEDFWPDPNRLNQIPKDRIELKLEIERLKQERAARRERRLQREAAAAAAAAKEEQSAAVDASNSATSESAVTSSSSSA